MIPRDSRLTRHPNCLINGVHLNRCRVGFASPLLPIAQGTYGNSVWDLVSFAGGMDWCVKLP